MRLTTDGLVIRENVVGEADKFVTLLTREEGILRAAARGSRRVNSHSAAATQLLTHVQLSLQQGKNNWYIDDARPLHVFFELHDDLEKLTLAQYFCELAGVLCPREEPAEEPLRLLLNALHFLAAGARPAALLKAAVECRLLVGAGYAPDLTACCRCGVAEGALRFLPAEGRLICSSCGQNGLALPPAVLAALRHLTTCPLERCFAFSLPPEQQDALAAVSEAFLLAQLGRGFSTLDFYHTLHS